MFNYFRKFACCILGIGLLTSCGDDMNHRSSTATTETATAETIQTKRIPFVLKRQYPHNTNAYTEGLQFVDGYMYESTGQYGNSYLYKYELETGKLVNEYKLDNKYFGEGMTVMGDKIYMLTYKAKTGFVFDKNSFKLLSTFTYNTGEGWGLTNDSTHLIYSDGSAYLYFLDPASFKETKRLHVIDKYGAVSNINELEYINGFIYANQYERDHILKIDPTTGHVVAESDMRQIRRQASIPENRHMEGKAEVMNGIAYDAATNRIFVTGKNWDKILEVTLDN